MTVSSLSPSRCENPDSRLSDQRWNNATYCSLRDVEAKQLYGARDVPRRANAEIDLPGTSHRELDGQQVVSVSGGYRDLPKGSSVHAGHMCQGLDGEIRHRPEVMGVTVNEDVVGDPSTGRLGWTRTGGVALFGPPRQSSSGATRNYYSALKTATAPLFASAKSWDTIG